MAPKMDPSTEQPSVSTSMAATSVDELVMFDKLLEDIEERDREEDRDGRGMKVFLMSSDDKYIRYHAQITGGYLVMGGPGHRRDDNAIRYKLKRIHVVTIDSQ